jgi:hypothetical protein
LTPAVSLPVSAGYADEIYADNGSLPDLADYLGDLGQQSAAGRAPSAACSRGGLKGRD